MLWAERDDPDPEPPGGTEAQAPPFYGFWPRLPEMERTERMPCEAPYPLECHLPARVIAR
jgi:hypothetical protein